MAKLDSLLRLRGRSGSHVRKLLRERWRHPRVRSICLEVNCPGGEVELAHALVARLRADVSRDLR